MHTNNLFLHPPPPSIAAVFLIFILFPTSFSTDDEQYTDCHSSSNCGSIQNITYPFWGFGRPSFCGRQGFELRCQNNEYPVLSLTTDGPDFRLLKLNPMTIARTDLWENHCNPEIYNTSLNYTLFEHAPTVRNITLFYNCTNIPEKLPGMIANSFNCSRDGVESVGFYTDDAFLNAELPENFTLPGNFTGNFTLPECEEGVRVPVLQAALDELGRREWSLDEALKKGFEVDYEADRGLCSGCEASGGICGSNHTDLSQFACLCRSHPYPSVCPKNGDGKNWKLKVTIGLVTAFVSITIMSVIFYIYLRRNKKQRAPFLSRNISPDSSSMTDAEKGGSHYGVHLFNYGELEEATNHFDSAKELGDGGFGTVYYGKLRDGRAVAVKRLYENNYRRVEQFMNEVDILTRLRHQNLVSLYGCTSRHSRELLLVYEYIPNGTVADNLHGERAKPGELPWPIRMNIAIETACALAYLHASEIIHRDVKTNNILLDNNFCVKVADFGLSRLFPTDVTHISTAPQGTPGYVDPEYHHCYQLTSKSDVYSFGVVLMELISSQPAVDITRHRHEINLSTLAINKILNHELHKLVDPSLGFESDYTVRKKISAVAELAFRCLQNAKEMRPSMVEVLQDLKDIQSDDYNEHKAAEMDIPKDDAVLLKNEQLPFSPDSVTTKWISTDTIRNPSG